MIKRLKSEFLKKDKIQHMAICAVIVIVLSFVLPLWVSALASIAVGGGKELYDKIFGGVCSIKDFVADLIGVVIGTIISIPIVLLI